MDVIKESDFQFEHFLLYPKRRQQSILRNHPITSAPETVSEFFLLPSRVHAWLLGWELSLPKPCRDMPQRHSPRG
jgi:hypothetical protein